MSSDTGTARRRPVGAEPRGGATSFRVWAPSRRAVSVVVEDGPELPLRAEDGGYFSGEVEGVGAGALYRFRLDGGPDLFPDPASRFQPAGPHGPSEVVDPGAFRWTDGDWKGIGLKGRIIYEMHVGTFTQESTWAAAAGKLPHLADLGIDTVEMMPVAEFAGTRGWGYDGVDLYAPTRCYGRPDDLRFFVDHAHALGIAVILDVVYNHLGPDGNYVAQFSPDYFSAKYATEWGEPINFDEPGAGPVREFFVQNAAHWIDEYHFDGLRLDATQSIFDASSRHVLGEIVQAARGAAAPRTIIVVGENEPQDTNLVRPTDAGGQGLDALWNDDLHHSAAVALTGRNEAYYEDHFGEPQEFIAAAKYGYLFQGQVYAHQGQRRGRPGLDLPPASFVTFLQNHDQIANSALGLPFHALSHPGLARAMTAYLLLTPGTPMLFQGQEFWASNPFFYFCDHAGDLGGMVRRGRIDFLRQFPTLDHDLEAQGRIPDPSAPDTFARSKLDWRDLERHPQALALHRDLIRLRRDDPVFAAQRPGGLDGCVIGSRVFALRYFGRDAGDRLMLVNLGRDLPRRSIADPLVSPPAGQTWSVLLSTEHSLYGGQGVPEVESGSGWRIPACSCTVLASA